MSQMAETQKPVEKADELSAGSRAALRTLILTLADSKRVLGIRYSDWMLGAPSLETGIAASSMAQDEWGHSRLTYALLSDFGDDPRELEHERDAREYYSMAPLDSPLESWGELIAAALLLDGALAAQYTALVNSRYSPVHKRVQKLLDEEEYHFQYAAGWAPQLAARDEPRTQFAAAARRLLPYALQWLGRPDTASHRLLLDDGLILMDVDQVRARFLSRIGPVLETASVADEVGLERTSDGWRFTGSLDWNGWDDERRRAGEGGPDAETISRVRGDKNRAMRLD